MALPFFYINEYDGVQTQLVLNEETSKHIVQVLRMKEGELINLTDGKGNLLTCEIVEENKKHCAVSIQSKSHNQKSKTNNITIAISLIKNTNRFEWFLEKATELGVNEIIPLICDRTEKERFRYDRMQGIVISAMLQSQQTWLPLLHEPTFFEKAVENAIAEHKFIAHCDEGGKEQITNKSFKPSSIILIGPEGDFTKQEITLALDNHFKPVSLGNTRLRTETAGMVAATLLVNSSS